ncbi:MAG: hypothetical protein ACI4W2_02365 [Eubacterium sp.]
MADQGQATGRKPQEIPAILPHEIGGRFYLAFFLHFQNACEEF